MDLVEEEEFRRAVWEVVGYCQFEGEGEMGVGRVGELREREVPWESR